MEVCVLEFRVQLFGSVVKQTSGYLSPVLRIYITLRAAVRLLIRLLPCVAVGRPQRLILKAR